MALTEPGALPLTLKSEPKSYRGLQLLLPEPLAAAPALVRAVSEFADWRCDLLGRTVRFNFVGALHDALVIRDGPAGVTLLLPCGVNATVERDQVSALVRDEGPDPNPRTVAQLVAPWVAAVTEGPRSPAVESIVLLNPGGDGGDGEYQEPEDDEPVPFDLRRWCGQFGSTHVRVRCFAPGESLRHPQRAPQILYAKMQFPYNRLQFADPDAQIPYQGYLREAAVYRLLPRCQPAVAPACHHAHFHLASMSNAIVLDDHVSWVHWHGTVGETRRHRHTGDLETVYQETESGARRIARALASLHGRFLVPKTVTQVDPALIATAEPRQALRSELVHEQLYERVWLRAVADAEFRDFISAVYGEDMEANPNPSAAAAALAEAKSAVAAEAAPSVTADASASGNATPATTSMQPSRKGSATTALSAITNASSRRSRVTGAAALTRHVLPMSAHGGSAASRLTLIHGDVCCEHVLMADDARSIPSVMLVDWKRAAIAPLEIDLLQLYLTLPPVRRAEEMRKVLQEYAEELSILYPAAPVFTVDEYFALMRNVCLVLAVGGPCPWNDFGRRCDEYSAAHRELVVATGLTPAAGTAASSSALRRKSVTIAAAASASTTSMPPDATAASA